MMEGLRPIKRPKSLRNQVYSTLLEGLRNGQIASDKPLVERDLATQLGVSRTPVREALALLESGDILVATGRGFMLKALSDSEIQEIYEIRQLLEPYAMRMAINSMSKSTLAALGRHYRKQAQAHKDEDIDAFCEANRRFRSCWIKQMTNRRLAAAIEMYDDHVVFLRKTTLQEATCRAAVLEGLAKLMPNMLDGDELAAEQVMSEHLSRAEVSLRNALKNLPKQKNS